VEKRKSLPSVGNRTTIQLKASSCTDWATANPNWWKSTRQTLSQIQNTQLLLCQRTSSWLYEGGMEVKRHALKLKQCSAPCSERHASGIYSRRGDVVRSPPPLGNQIPSDQPAISTLPAELCNYYFLFVGAQCHLVPASSSCLLPHPRTSCLADSSLRFLQ